MKHLEQQGFTYWQHFKRALKFSFYFYVASLRFAVHAVYPDCCEWTVAWLKDRLDD